MLANLRNLGRLAGWPLGRLAGLAAALLVAVVLALLCHSRTPPPIVERSSRGLALATLPHVAALVAPSARVRTRANRGTRQGLSRTLRRSQCRACWPPSRWISRRYRSAQRPERVRAWSARERCESAEVARPHLRSASRRWAGWRPLRCHKPGMQATARAHRRPARRYQGAEHVGQFQSRARQKPRPAPHSQQWRQAKPDVLAWRDESESRKPCAWDFVVREPRNSVALERGGL